jgi:hypothetical protein
MWDNGNAEHRKNIEKLLNQFILEKKYGEIMIKFEDGKIIYIKFSETIKEKNNLTSDF